MNEWEIQHILTKHWRKNALKFEGIEYSLVCWELMFPSWQINNKMHKWNEISIDFVFYSEIENIFLCAELKNEIRGRKSLLSAYCQTIQRGLKFNSQYSVGKITQARIDCFESPVKERGGLTENNVKIEFKKHPRIERVLMAMGYPKNADYEVSLWDELTLTELKAEVRKYSKNKEFIRFAELTDYEFNKLRESRIKLIPIKQFVIYNTEVSYTQD